MADVPKKVQRYENAKKRKDQWMSMLRDAYRYALPNHDPDGNSTKGKQNDVEVFDATAVNAVADKRNRLHGDLFPPYQEWMDFAPDDPEVDPQEWAKHSTGVREKYHRAIEASNFHIEVPVGLGDSFISTGCLMVHEGTPESPLYFEAVPVSEYVPEEAKDGILRTVYRLKQRELSMLEQHWPKAAIPKDIQEKIKKDPQSKMGVLETVIYDPETGNYDYTVFLETGWVEILSEELTSSPFIPFRQDKAPGEWMGRGPVLNVLADIKTANKVIELTLMNALFAIKGVWQGEDDGVLNPANVQIIPGAVIPHGPGSQGLRPLESAARFDVSQLVLDNLQENIRRAILGPDMPDPTSGIRTAYELSERRADGKAVELPKGLRILTELTEPLARRVLDILTSPAMAGSPFYIQPLEIDGKKINPKPISPLVKYQEKVIAAQKQQAYGSAVQVAPDVAPKLVDRTKFIRNFLLDNGFSDEEIMSEEDAVRHEAAIRIEMQKIEAQQRIEAQEQGGGVV